MKKKHNLEKTHALDVISAGVPVRVCFDGDGRPLYATAGHDGEDERFVELAAKAAYNAAHHAAARSANETTLATATASSAKNRAKASTEHWANKWFEKAHTARPEYGRSRLAQYARRLFVNAPADDPDAKGDWDAKRERDEITVDRAQQFLDRKRKRPQ